MAQVIQIQPHLRLEDIDQRLTTITTFWRIRRWTVIRQALVDPAPANALARRVGLSLFTVRDLIQAYNRYGPVALDTPGKGQRQRAYLSLAEERAFLEQCIAQSRAGQLVTIRQIKHALENNLGHPVSQSMIARLLQRHQWRKLVPRPKRPNSSQAEQEAFKKTSNTKLSRQWQPEMRKIDALS
jgi:transposase